jgi:glutaredoxin
MFTIYGTDWCEFCIKAKELLDEKKIPYSFKNVDDGQVAEDFKKLIGKDHSSIPQIFNSSGGFHELIGGYTELSNKLK